MKRHGVIVAFGVLLVSMLWTTSQTQAQTKLNLDGHYKGSKGLVFIKREDLLHMATTTGLKVHLVKFVKLSKHDLEKLTKCGCAAPVQDGDLTGGWKCVKGCLSDWGVPSTMIWACTASCGLGVPSCIACLGVTEYIVAGCAMYCAWWPVIVGNGNDELIGRASIPRRPKRAMRVRSLR